MIQIQYQSSNSVVTDYYLNIIAKILNDGIYDTNHKLYDCKKEDIIIVPTSIEFCKVYLKGFRRIIYWMQGLDGEESYLKHHSSIRRQILDKITKFALKRSTAIFFVSEEMKRYEEEKLKINVSDRSFIMPCFNVSKEEGLYFDENKYEKNVFTYVGSLTRWQCFPQTVDLYKKIENTREDVELRVYTFSEEEAERVLKEKKVRNYLVTSVSPDKMTSVLREVKFGFVLRDNIPVNRVATPTKLSSYLSAGVIPIFSDCLVDFYEKTKKMDYIVPMDDYDLVPDKLQYLMEHKTSVEHLKKEYQYLFETYYNPDYYVGRYKTRLRKLVESQ